MTTYAGAYPAQGGTGPDSPPLSFPSADPSTLKVWSKRVETEALPKTLLNTFLQSGIIARKQDLTRSAGDEVRYSMRALLSGDGKLQNARLSTSGDSNEEASVYYWDNASINQLRHAVSWYGKIDAQRVIMDIRRDARDGLSDWWAERLDYWMINQLAGSTALHDEAVETLEDGVPVSFKRSGMNYATAPDANHYIDATSTKFDYDLVEDMLVKAKTFHDQYGQPVFRPVRIAGGEYFPVLLHTYSWRDLRRSAGDGKNSEWMDVQLAAMSGGLINKNPIFTGSAGTYGSCIFFELSRMPGVPLMDTTGGFVANQKRALMLGKGAGVLLEGKGYGGLRFDWTEDSYDLGNEQVIGSGLIGGMKKCTFGDDAAGDPGTPGPDNPDRRPFDYAVITADVFAAADPAAVPA